MTTLYRADVVDTPVNPFTDPDALRAESDVCLAVDEGRIVRRGSWTAVAPEFPDAEIVDLRDGLLLPGFVDTHVHYPQVRIIGGLGLPLLDWLDQRALPEEARLADPGYAQEIADDFCAGMVRCGTTSALVFGSHFAPAVDALFATAEEAGLKVTSGLVVSDRMLRDDLLTDPARSLGEGRALVERWHGRGRLRYAVTPRFSLSASDALLDACAELAAAADGIVVTSHINENPAEIATVAELFPGSRDYLDTYDRHGLVGPRTVLAHDVHPTEPELARLAQTGAWIAHCPTSNAALGSGLFPFRRHVDAGVNVALGTDVGGGTGFSMFKEGLQAHAAQHVQGDAGYPLAPAHLLWLATRAGALALGRGDETGDLGEGRAFDAVHVRPRPGTTMKIVLDHAVDLADALARVFTLGSSADVDRVWIDGELAVDASHDQFHPPTSRTFSSRSLSSQDPRRTS